MTLSDHANRDLANRDLANRDLAKPDLPLRPRSSCHPAHGFIAQAHCLANYRTNLRSGEPIASSSVVAVQCGQVCATGLRGVGVRGVGVRRELDHQ